jgi:hypothetical protein
MNEYIQQNRKKKNLKILVVLFILISVTIAYAKYSSVRNLRDGQADAERFYFITNILGDSTMLDASGATGDGSTYSFPECQSGTWYLYGKDKHAINIQIQNYSDDLRITEDSISYTANVTGSNNYDTSNITLQNTNQGNKETYSLTGNQKSTDNWLLEIPAYNEQEYSENTYITVTLESISPYKKDIELNFILSTEETVLTYRIEDSADSPYASLILMNYAVIQGSTNTITPNLTWSNNLFIDNTNTLTYSYTNGSFTQQDNMASRNSMYLNRALNPSESVSIYFFKKYTSEDYSTETTIVTPNNGVYSINIPDLD